MHRDEEILAVFRDEVAQRLLELGRELSREPEGWDADALCRITHNLKGTARMLAASPVHDAAHALEDLFAAVRDRTTPPTEIAGLVREGSRLLQRCLDAFLADTPSPGVDEFADRVHELLGASPEHRAREARRGESAKAEERTVGVADRGGGSLRTLRVGVDKLDLAIGLASELITSIQSGAESRLVAGRLSRQLEELQRRRPELRAVHEFTTMVTAVAGLERDLAAEATRAGRLSAELQDAIRVLRMVPVAGLEPLFMRVVRDAANSCGREARLILEGGETEIDRSILESLTDPVVHLLRNAVAHGIEPAEEREAAGKDRVGTIVLRAHPAGAWVEIAVVDDGRGISIDKLRERAVARGSFSAQEAERLSPDAVLRLIFTPGFSTQDTADALSGRGVGLDVVQEAVRRLGGRIDVQGSFAVGTSFRILVPLTRLLTMGVVARLGPLLVAVPAENMERTLMVDTADKAQTESNCVILDGEPVPMIALENVLHIGSELCDRRPAVIICEKSRRRAVLVDEVVGQREFMIQPLPWNLRSVPGIAGAAVLERGRIAMLLDTEHLIEIDAQVAGARRPTPQRAKPHRRRVMVVDDSVTSRTLVQNILASAGYEVAAAVDGEQAWQMLAETEFDVVVTDVEMPRLSGFELTRRIRGDARLKSMPVVLVTRMGEEDHKREGAEAGANAYVVKGAFEQDELLTAVGRLV